MTHSLVMLRPPDREQLVAAATGDRAALEAVARMWWPDVRRWCLIDTGDPVLADDAAQETLVRLVRFIGGYDPERPFRAWLRRLAGNASRDQLARQAKQRNREASPDAAPEGTAARGWEPGLDLKRTSRRALAALGALTPRQREVFVLCDCEGLNATEAADALGVEPPTVRVLLSRARKALRTRLLAEDPTLADLFGGSHGR